MELTEYFDALAEMPNLRSASFDDLEIKDGGNVYLFDGYAAVHDEIADCGDFTEEVRQGAFDQVLASGANVPMLHEHHPHQLLATTKSGRLKLEADSKGLRAKAKLVKTDLSARIKALVESGDITGMSYGFVAGRGNFTVERRSGRPHRILTNFKRLLDVSTTWDPAFVTTEAQFRARSIEYAKDPASWQLLLMGALPQLAELGHDDEVQETGEETRTADQIEEASPGVETPLLSAAKRRLEIENLNWEGDPDGA